MLFVCLMPGVSIADVQGGRYVLGPLDVVRVKVYEWRASRDEVFDWKPLNDQFAIGPEGTLSLPLIGEVDATGLNTAELGQRIAEQFKEHMGFAEAPSVSVEVVRFRPFYITGDVHAPGEFPYRPGLTVLQALSLAGGFYRETGSGHEVIAARGELGLINSDMIQHVARRARLEAEQRGDSEIKFPNELLQRTSDASVARLLEQEQLVFDTRRRGFDTEVKALEELRSFLQANIGSIQSQVETEVKQIELVRKEFDTIQTLLTKGLTSVSHSLELERNLAQLEGERLKVVSSLNEARQELSKTELALIALRNKRANDTALELSQAQAEINTLVHKYDMNEQLLIGAATQTRSPLNDPNFKPAYTIVRRSSSGPTELPADEGTAVEPGDTVKVVLPVLVLPGVEKAFMSGQPMSKSATQPDTSRNVSGQFDASAAAPAERQ